MMSAKEADPVPRYSQGQIGANFKIQLFDVDSQYNPIVADLTNADVNTAKIVFVKPDGVVLEIPATVDGPATKGTLEMTTDADNDILDQRGIWQYTAQVIVNGKTIKGVTRHVFYVI